MKKLNLITVLFACIMMISCQDNPDEDYIMKLNPGTGVINYHTDSTSINNNK